MLMFGTLPLKFIVVSDPFSSISSSVGFGVSVLIHHVSCRESMNNPNSEGIRTHNFYRPHPREDGEGTVFTGVCLSTRGGVP